jgi:S1-C subfamily serine protease
MPSFRVRKTSSFGLALALAIVAFSATRALTFAGSLQDTIRATQQKVVKIYGAGGVRGLEAYQTGIIISPEGHVLTALSYVLDTDELTVVLDDGRHFTAEQLGIDQVAELAVLKLPLESETVPAFNLSDAAMAQVGDRVLALSNLYNIAAGDEPVSVLQGVVTAIAPLAARRGSFVSNYRGNVYIVDAAANNPGAAGGALVDWQGRLLGVLGKELKSSATGAWLHYALPIGEIASAVDRLRAGETIESGAGRPLAVEPITLTELGLVLVPDVLPRTPPYIDTVFPDSPAARAGLRPDDLVVDVAGESTASCKSVGEVMARQERFDELKLSVLRDGELIEVNLLVDDMAVSDGDSDSEVDSESEADSDSEADDE